MAADMSHGKRWFVSVEKGHPPIASDFYPNPTNMATLILDVNP